MSDKRSGEKTTVPSLVGVRRFFRTPPEDAYSDSLLECLQAILCF
jgi:hypothetical protein